MGSFIYKQTGINALVMEVSAAASAIGNGLTSVKDASDNISDDSEWQGNKATSVKDYLTYVHGSVIASLQLIIKNLYDQTMLYQEGYNSIDGNPYAVISETELSRIGNELISFAELFDGMDQETRSIINSVSYIGSIGYSGLNDLPVDLSKLKEKLFTLRDDIGDHETAFQTRFNAEREIVNSVRQMLQVARSTNLEAFSAASLAGNKAYQKLASDYQALAQIVEGNAEKVKQAETTFAGTLEVLQEDYEKRVEEAKKAKFWTGVATAAVSAVVITATGVGSYYDQKIGTVACPGTVNGFKVAGAAFFGGVVGAATGAVSAQFGQMANNLAGEGIKLAMKKAGVDALKSVSVGMITRAGDGCYDSISAGRSPLNWVGDSLSNALDPQKMLGDAAGGFAGSVFTQGFDKVSGNLSDKLFGNTSEVKPYKNAIQVTKAKNPLLHQGYDILSSTAKESGKGIVKRGVGTFAETGDLKKSFDNATDLEAIKTDAATTFVSETASTATADAKSHAISRTRNAQKKINEIEEKVNEETAEYNKRNEKVCEERGIKRTENGTPDFKDTDDCAAETMVEQVVAGEGKNTKQLSSNQDYKNAFDKMVAEGKLSEEYTWDDGNVIRKQVVYKNGKPTTVETTYTVHHVEYDVNTGKGRFQLVKTDAHNGIKHAGGASQADKAYHKYGVGDNIKEYNDAVREANDLRTGKIDNKTGKNDKRVTIGVKSAKKGYESGAKVKENVKEEEIWSSVDIDYDLNFAFLGT